MRRVREPARSRSTLRSVGRLQPEQLAEFRALQTAILEECNRASLDSGESSSIPRCSASNEREENEEVVESILRAMPSVRRVPASEIARILEPNLAPDIEVNSLFDETGQFRIFPGEHSTDGFFAAVLKKT